MRKENPLDGPGRNYNHANLEPEVVEVHRELSSFLETNGELMGNGLFVYTFEHIQGMSPDGKPIVVRYVISKTAKGKILQGRDKLAEKPKTYSKRYTKLSEEKLKRPETLDSYNTKVQWRIRRSQSILKLMKADLEDRLSYRHQDLQAELEHLHAELSAFLEANGEQQDEAIIYVSPYFVLSKGANGEITQDGKRMLEEPDHYAKQYAALNEKKESDPEELDEYNREVQAQINSAEVVLATMISHLKNQIKQTLKQHAS